MESDLKIFDPFSQNNTIAKIEPNACDKYQKLLKYFLVNDNIDNLEVCGSTRYSDVTMLYPINPWTFWYRNPAKLHSKYPWEESLTKIVTVRDITQLWKILNHIVQPSVKFLNMSLFVFNENSVPAWEHKSNENAGRWIIILNDNRNLHNTWNNMVLQVVGDEFATVANDLNGIGLHVKPVCSKITVWTTKTTLDNYKNICKIGILSKKTIGPTVKRMYYLMHNRLLN